MNKKKIITYLILAMFAVSFLPIMSNTVGADSWTRWQTITVSNPDNNCQVWMNVSYDADMKADFGDVHFTKLDNTTELDYWMEQKVNSDWAWFWVELPADIEGTPNFNMLYGDASSTTLSNGANTFEWFDDFTDNVTHVFDSVAGSGDNQFFVNDTGLTLTTNYGVWYKFNSTDYTPGANNVQIIIGTSDDDMSGTDKVADGTHFGLSTGGTSGANATNQDYFISGRVGSNWVWSGGSTSDVHIPYTADRQKLLHTKVNSTRAINFSFLDNDDHTYYTSTYDVNNPNPPTNWSVDASHPNLNCKYLYFHTDDDSGTATHLHTTIDGNGYKYFHVQDGTQKIGQYYDYVFITEEPDTPPSLSFGGEGERDDSESFSCSATSHEYGSWEYCEKVLDGELDESWTNLSLTSNDWFIHDRSSEWGGNYSYSFFNAGSYSGINETFLDNSGVNRSQIVLNVHLNDTTTNVSLGPVIQDCDGNKLYFLAGPSSSAYILYYNATTESYWDVSTRGEINLTDVNPDNLTNWVGDADPGILDDELYQWETNLTQPDGVWIKLLTNPFCECYKFKFWGDDTYNGLMWEPAGWITEFCDLEWDLLSCNLTCTGLAVWNGDGDKETRADFDIISLYQENYTLNSSSATELYPDGKPFMEFPIVNSSLYLENLTNFIIDAFAGNMSQEYLIPYLVNITNATNKESRPYTPDDWTGVQDYAQNDTIRYHSAFLTNATELGFDYNNYLWLYVHATPYGLGVLEDEWCMVLIDMPPVGTWEINDRIYWRMVDGTEGQWDGNMPMPVMADMNAWYTSRTSYQNIYRYNEHTQFNFFIPQWDLVDGDGNPVNNTHVFNMTILTGAVWDTNICVWNNYNETACDTYLGSEEATEIKPFFINSSYINDNETAYTINDTCSFYWGQGQITGAETLGGEATYNFTLEKTVNETAVGGEHAYYLLNYSVYINNTGTGTLTDIYINETWHECICSNYNWSIDSISVANSTFDDWHNDSCYWIIHNDSWSIAQGAGLHVWYVMNVTNCTGNLSGYVYNNATVNATGVTPDKTDSVSTLFGAQASRVRIIGAIPYTDLTGTTNSVFTIIGALLIVGCIMLIIGVAKKNNLF